MCLDGKTESVTFLGFKGFKDNLKARLGRKRFTKHVTLKNDECDTVGCVVEFSFALYEP